MRFMVQAKMNKKQLSEKELSELITVLPAQEALDSKLIAQGIREGRTVVAADRSTAWMVMNCESEDEVQEILRTFPTYNMSTWHITQVLSEEDNLPK